VPLWNLSARSLFGPSSETTYARVLGTKLTSNLLPDPNWRLGIMAQFVNDYDDVSDNRVEDLNQVDRSFLIGAVGGYDLNLGGGQVLGAEVQAAADVLHGNGYLITFGPKYTAQFGDKKWSLSAGLNTTYASDDYMSNYFSINSGEASKSGLDEYSADAGFKDVAADLGLTYAINRAWSVTGIGRYERMTGDAADSPVVDDRGDKNQWFGGVLINYGF